MADATTSESAHTSVRCLQGSRVVYYMEKADAQFWDRHWQRHLSPDVYRAAEQGDLGELWEPFTRYLPRQGRILEAGCGLGQRVLALRTLGYDVEGVEWAEATVQAVRSMRPDLPIRVGDVTRLDVPPGYYAAYISLGVVEHCADGPEPFLREAWRVLAPGGVILVSVPYFHVLRRLKAHLGCYNERTDGLEFYQYAFTQKEFLGILCEAGFEILETFNCDPVGGIRSEIPFIRFLMERRFIGHRLKKLISNCAYARRHLGHMLLVVAKARGKDDAQSAERFQMAG